MQFYWFTLGILCTWRITHLLSAEDGPFDMFARLRGLAGAGIWGKMLDCFECLSLFVAAPLAVVIGASWSDCALGWPALSGGAILLERATASAASPTPPVYSIEDQENDHGLLRKDPPTNRDEHGPGDPN